MEMIDEPARISRAIQPEFLFLGQRLYRLKPGENETNVPTVRGSLLYSPI